MSAAARTIARMMRITTTGTTTLTRTAEWDVRPFRDRRLERGEPAEDRPGQHLDLRGRPRRRRAPRGKSGDPARGEGFAQRHAGGGDATRRTCAARLRLSV